MHMYHFHRYTHTALSVSYGTVYTCPMGRLQRWCMYLVVCDAVLVIIIIIIIITMYASKEQDLDQDTLIEQSQYSEKQCSKLLRYICVVINKEI